MLLSLSSVTQNVSSLILIINQTGSLPIWFAQDFSLVERMLVREIQVRYKHYLFIRNYDEINVFARLLFSAKVHR